MPVTWSPKALEQEQEKDVEANLEEVKVHRFSFGGLRRREKHAIDEAKLTPEQRNRLATWEDAIQPHTDEGGDAYYIGDAYEGIDPACIEEWGVKDADASAYLRYVKHLATTLPHLEYLAHWMEVTAAPPKWRFIRNLPERRAERAQRTKVCVIDYFDHKTPKTREFDSTRKLQTFLCRALDPDDQPQARLLVVEDLSRDLVGMLGEHFDIDPNFFLSHISDYLFHNTRDPWVELSSLDVDARNASFFNLQYLRARYFKTEAEFNEAERQSGLFNVLRRLDSDRSRRRLQKGLLDRVGASVTLSRSKTSFWVQPLSGEDVPEDRDGQAEGGTEEATEPDDRNRDQIHPRKPIIGILLVDPTVETGQPLWRGHLPFEAVPAISTWAKNPKIEAPAPPSMRAWHAQMRWPSSSPTDQGGHPANRLAPSNKDLPRSLYDDVVYYCSKATQEDLEIIKRNPRHIATPMYRLVLSDWRCVLKYMTTMLAKLEWEFEKPHWGEPDSIDQLLKKLSPWRRNIGYYQSMIADGIARLFPSALHSQLDPLGEPSAQPTLASPPLPGDNASGILALWTDFKNVKQQMNDSQQRIKSIEQQATNYINTEEARRAVEQNERAVQQNKNLARLTFLAMIFIPLNFTSSFLSMSPDFPQPQNYLTIGLFFAIGIPITLAALITVDITHPQPEKSWCRKTYRNFVSVNQKSPQTSEAAEATVGRAVTLPWIRPAVTRK